MSYLQFYAKKEVQQEILRVAKDREISFKYGDGGFGKRPDILQFAGDVFELAKAGVTSFHISEETWNDPLSLATGMRRHELDALRKGWDLILDIDTPDLEYSKIIARVIIDSLKFHDIETFSLKYSGNKGFHIGIPFESFPDKVNGKETRVLFPEGPRVVAAYLKEIIRDPLSAAFLAKYPLEELAKSINKEPEELSQHGKIDPFEIGDIDTVLISSRHMFRAPYSYHEKSGLISIPLKEEDIERFDKEWAKPENVKFDVPFLTEDQIPNSSNLLIQSFDWFSKNQTMLEREKSASSKIMNERREYKLPSQAVPEDCFPPCMKKMGKGIEDDGRKRCLFILINFLRNLSWDKDKLKEYIDKWNKNNYEQLREGYIISQIQWAFRQPRPIMPPNCDNKAYYQDLRYCTPDNLCKKIKNPINYAVIKSKPNDWKPKKKTRKKKSNPYPESYS